PTPYGPRPAHLLVPKPPPLPIAVPPSPPVFAGESKATHLAPIGEFDSSSEHPVLPGAPGQPSVTVTRIKGGKSRLVVPSSPDLEPVEDLDQMLMNRALAVEEEPVPGDGEIQAPSEELDERDQARRQRMRLFKIVGGSLAATVLAFLVYYWATNSTQDPRTDSEQTV